MQASYIMAANEHAPRHLPEGAEIDALTYGQLIQWTGNVQKVTGEPKIGFPAPPKGLEHRFFQGYPYPSHANDVARSFASDEAVVA